MTVLRSGYSLKHGTHQLVLGLQIVMLDGITHIAPAGQDGGFSVVAEEELHQLRDGDVNRIALLLFGEDSGEQSDWARQIVSTLQRRQRERPVVDRKDALEEAIPNDVLVSVGESSKTLLLQQRLRYHSDRTTSVQGRRTANQLCSSPVFPCCNGTRGL